MTSLRAVLSNKSALFHRRWRRAAKTPCGFWLVESLIPVWGVMWLPCLSLVSTISFLSPEVRVLRTEFVRGLLGTFPWHFRCGVAAKRPLVNSLNRSFIYSLSVKMTIPKSRNCTKRDIKSKHQTNRSPEFWNQLVQGPLKKIEKRLCGNPQELFHIMVVLLDTHPLYQILSTPQAQRDMLLAWKPQYKCYWRFFCVVILKPMMLSISQNSSFKCSTGESITVRKCSKSFLVI